MDAHSVIKSAKDYIEDRVLGLKKKYEVIYSSAKENEKKSSILKTIEEIERDLRKIRSDVFLEKDLKKYDINMKDLESHIFESKKEKKESRILRNIVTIKLNLLSTGEIDSIWSYLNFFGREYLGFLSEQNLRLDYGHAFQRDNFFTLYNQTIRVLEDYGKLLDELSSAKDNKNKDHINSLLKMQSKEYRNVIIKTGFFLKTIQGFIEDLLESEKEGEKVLLEPDRIVQIQGENSSIDGSTARQALMDLSVFINEFIDFLKIPDLKKIGKEEEKLS